MKDFALGSIHDVFTFETLVVTTSGKALTVATFASTTSPFKIAQYALVTVETAPIRWRADGTVPTTSVGHLLNINDILEIIGSNNLKNSNFIATSSSADIMVGYAY